MILEMSMKGIRKGSQRLFLTEAPRNYNIFDTNDGMAFGGMLFFNRGGAHSKFAYFAFLSA